MSDNEKVIEDYECKIIANIGKGDDPSYPVRVAEFCLAVLFAVAAMGVTFCIVFW